MSFVFEFSRLINISEKSFIKSIQSFKGLEHRFEIFMKKKNVTLSMTEGNHFQISCLSDLKFKKYFWILGSSKKGDKINLFKYKKYY